MGPTVFCNVGSESLRSMNPTGIEPVTTRIVSERANPSATRTLVWSSVLTIITMMMMMGILPEGPWAR